MNILVVLPMSFADVVCSTALLRCVHRQVTGALLHVVVPEEFGHVLLANPHVAELHSVHNLHTVIAPGKYEVLLDVAGLEENKKWAEDAGARYLSYPKPSLFRSFFQMLGQKKNHPTSAQMVAIAEPLNVRYDGAGMDYFVAPEHQVPQRDIPVSHSAGYLVFVLGNELPVHHEVLMHCCTHLQFPIMFTGPKSMFNTAQHFADIDNVKVYNACGKFSDNETADLLQRSRLVVSGDIGWLQVGAALRRPVVGLGSAKSLGAQWPPIYPALQEERTKPPYALVQVSGATFASVAHVDDKPHPQQVSAGTALVQVINEFLAAKEQE